MPGDLTFDPQRAQASNNYQVFDLVLRYYGQGEDWCWPGQLTTKRTTVQVYMRDATSGVNDWISAKVDPVPKTSSGGFTGSIHWSISVGGRVEAASFGISLSYVPASGIAIYPSAKNVQLSDGWKHLAELSVHWDGGKQTSMDVAWPMHVWESKAQYRLWDKVQFKVTCTIVFDLFNPSWPWIGPGPWIGYDWTLTESFIRARGSTLTAPTTWINTLMCRSVRPLVPSSRIHRDVKGG